MHDTIRSVALFALAIFAFDLFCTPQTDSQSSNISLNETGEPTIVTRPPTKWALLVGIDKYRHTTNRFPNLAGCVNDVMNMKSLLIGKFGFPEANIDTLTNERATRAGIIDAIQSHLIANAERDDIVVFHYSGHGSQMTDASGDETDGLDETLVPHDSRDPEGKVFDISDDEINGLLRVLLQKTNNVTFIFDCCNSGTAVRGAGLCRSIPPDDRQPPPPAPYALSERGIKEGRVDFRAQNLDYVFISAALEKQSAREHYADGKMHGALTYFLTRELRHAGTGVTWRDVMDRVQGNVNTHYFDQLPQLEGTHLDQYVFNDSADIAQPYILTSPYGNDLAILDAGEAHGLTAGSLFEVYKPETKKFDDTAKSIAKVELTEVGPFKSEAKVIEGKVLAYSRAIEREHHYPDVKLRIFYHDLPGSATLQAIKSALDKYNHIEATPEATGYQLLLRESNNTIVTEWADTTVVSQPVPVNDVNVVARVEGQITQWARWFNLLSIDSPISSYIIDLKINVLHGGQSRSPFERVDSAEAVLRTGEVFECLVKNKSKGDIYFSILDLSTDGSISTG